MNNECSRGIDAKSVLNLKFFVHLSSTISEYDTTFSFQYNIQWLYSNVVILTIIHHLWRFNARFLLRSGSSADFDPSRVSCFLSDSIACRTRFCIIDYWKFMKQETASTLSIRKLDHRLSVGKSKLRGGKLSILYRPGRLGGTVR